MFFSLALPKKRLPWSYFFFYEKNIIFLQLLLSYRLSDSICRLYRIRSNYFTFMINCVYHILQVRALATLYRRLGAHCELFDHRIRARGFTVRAWKLTVFIFAPFSSLERFAELGNYFTISPTTLRHHCVYRKARQGQ